MHTYSPNIILTSQVGFSTFANNYVSAVGATSAYGGAMCMSQGLLRDYNPVGPHSSSAKILNTNFNNNFATVKDFSDTEAVTAGGAVLIGHFMVLDQRGVIFQTVNFEGNSAYYGGDGGAVAMFGLKTAATFVSTTFKKNVAWSRVADISYGGAMFVSKGAKVWLQDACEFFDNYAGTQDASAFPDAFPGRGGALTVLSGLLSCVGCRFERNIASNTVSDGVSKGGAVYVGPIEDGFSQSKPTSRPRTSIKERSQNAGKGPWQETQTFTNCIFLHNSVQSTKSGSGKGGALATYLFSVEIVGCLFVNNTAETSSLIPALGGAISLDTTSEGSKTPPLIRDCIFDFNMVCLSVLQIHVGLCIYSMYINLPIV